jgi:hypothetical protein
MPDYEPIDLSAHGPRRGLLCAQESIHPVKPAPPLNTASESHISVQRKGQTKDHVFCALTWHWQAMRSLVNKTGHRKEAIRPALRALVAQGFAEVRRADQAGAFQQTKAEWRRVR